MNNSTDFSADSTPTEDVLATQKLLDAVQLLEQALSKSDISAQVSTFEHAQLRQVVQENRKLKARQDEALQRLEKIITSIQNSNTETPLNIVNG